MSSIPIIVSIRLTTVLTESLVTHEPLCAMTVAGRLQHDFGLTLRKPARKPLLTKAIKEKPLKFANVHHHWTTEDWSKVLLSDES